MDQHDILRVIARQLWNQRNHLDALARVSDLTEAAKCAYDRASGKQRDMEMAEIEPLMTAEDHDIYGALVELGPGLTIEYLQHRAGSSQLAGHRSLYAACVKFGHPELSWEDASAQARQVMGLALKNPQSVIFHGLKDAGDKAFAAWKQNGTDCAALPYFADRFYMNGIIRNLAQGDPFRWEDDSSLGDSLRLSRLLFDAAIKDWERTKDQPHLIDESLRVCAFITLACQELPGYSGFSEGWQSDEPNPVLQHLDKAISTLKYLNTFSKAASLSAHYDSQIADACTLKARVERYAGTDEFTNPVKCSHRLYDFLETEKLKRLLSQGLENVGPSGGISESCDPRVLRLP